MNVLKPQAIHDILVLLNAGLSIRKVHEKTGVHRDVIAKYKRLHNMDPCALPHLSTGSPAENGPPLPPVRPSCPKSALSACAPFREQIELAVLRGRNAKSIYEELVDSHGFAHKYSSVKRFVRHLRKKEPERYDVLEFLPGEEAQVDYGEGAKVRCPETGKLRKTRLFVMTLRYSRRSFRKVVFKSDQETWARLHEEAFRYFGGSPQYLVLDNLKEGVLKPDVSDPQLNPLYAALLAHYGVVADPCRIHDPDRKGTVEKAIDHTQQTALKGKEFASIEEQNVYLMHWEESWASKRMHGRAKRQVAQMFEEERPSLKPLPVSNFRFFKQETRTVWEDGLVEIAKEYYSAPAVLLLREIPVRIYPYEIELLCPESLNVLRRYARKFRPGSMTIPETDRIFNPTRRSGELLYKAAQIGPATGELAREVFRRDGRPAIRRLYGLIGLTQKFAPSDIEEASKDALARERPETGVVKQILQAREKFRQGIAGAKPLVQESELIRSLLEYEEHFNNHCYFEEMHSEH